MPQYVAFLRAINVGGRYIKMLDLAGHVSALGLASVQTYINTGNLIFEDPSKSTAGLEKRLQTGLALALGFESEAFVRTLPALQTVTSHAQQMKTQVTAAGEVNVAFLQRHLTGDEVKTVLGLRSEVDDFEIVGSEIYWRCQVKQDQSKVSNALLERKLKTRTTIRRVSMLENLGLHLQSTASRRG
jgi:uncharacterized protein (DUF1697 family)